MLHVEGYHMITDNPGPIHSQMRSHEYYEIYCFLAGDAEYCVEGRRYFLQPGDLILLCKGEVHHYELNSRGTYERIGVHFDLPDLQDTFNKAHLLSPFLNRSSGSFNHYPAQLFPNRQWLFYLQKISQAQNRMDALCYLLPLLMDIAECFPVLQKSPPVAERDPASPIIKYINQNLSEDLSLDKLCHQFFVSKTHINRLFRQATGTTVWDYITVKRLFLAREKIQAGANPSIIFSECGFRDYSTFFRAYKNHFGYSPSSQKSPKNKYKL